MRGLRGLIVGASAALFLVWPGGSLAAGPPPPGANRADCTPPAGTVPVVLVHGTNSDMTVNWPYVSSALTDAGHCVWALDLPDRARVSMVESAGVLRRFVREVRSTTDMKRVSIVGHSLGGVVARYFIRFLEGRHQVQDLISLGSPHLGYESSPENKPIDDAFNTGCESCVEQAAGSDVLSRLNRGDMTPGKRVGYTQIGTDYDEIVTPPENVYLPADRGVSNIRLQERCPDHFVEHLGLAFDPLVLQWIFDALKRRGPADPDAAISC